MAKRRGINLDTDEILAEGLLSDEAETEDVNTTVEEVEEKEEIEEFLLDEAEESKPPATPGE